MRSWGVFFLLLFVTTGKSCDANAEFKKTKEGGRGKKLNGMIRWQICIRRWDSMERRQFIHHPSFLQGVFGMGLFSDSLCSLMSCLCCLIKKKNPLSVLWGFLWNLLLLLLLLLVLHWESLDISKLFAGLFDRLLPRNRNTCAASRCT